MGFKFELIATGKGSGGHFSYGHFIKEGASFGETKRIELHFRYSLGLVGYYIDDVGLSHQEYIDFVGKHGQSKYPNFSDNPQDAFNCLLWDLQNLLNDFTENDARIFKQKMADIRHQQGMSNEIYNRECSGEPKLIESAKAAFKKGNYEDVDKIKQQLRYPELLSPSEKKLFELNDQKMKAFGKK